MDGGVEPRLCYLPSTPQSIAKPSPGWNKVALLTAVRNSPCSCPFSVSLIRPLGALNSEPRSGSLLVLPPTKSCPRLWGKWHEVPKGVRLKTAECRELFPLSFAYAQQLPRFTVEPLGAVQTRRTVPYPFAERSFQWGYGGCRGA